MSARKRLRDAYARGGLAMARALGAKVQFSHADGPEYDIWALPGEEEISLIQDGGMDTQIKTRKWTIPLQPGFPASETQIEPCQPGDSLTHDGKVYYVLEGGCKKIDEDGQYEVRVVERRRSASGVRG